MKTNFSDQISYRFPRLFPSTAIFSCDISYISILSRHELFYEFLVSVKLKNNPLEMVSAHCKHLPSAQYEKDNSGPQTFGKMSLFLNFLRLIRTSCGGGRKVRCTDSHKITWRTFRVLLYKFSLNIRNDTFSKKFVKSQVDKNSILIFI